MGTETAYRNGRSRDSRPWREPRATTTAKATSSALVAFAAPITLYLLAATLLLIALNGHPPFSYNWEEYTAWRFFPVWDGATTDIFRRTDGLMTDGGLTPLVALPVWVGFKLFGPGLLGLRLPLALLSALAVPLLFFVGRRLACTLPATLAALLLALAPVFLLYGRTGTSVGISLVPALLTIYALLRVLEKPNDYKWLLGLQALLLLDIYAYAPIRFLWPLSLFLFAVQGLRRSKDNSALLRALLLTAIILPTALMLTRQPGEVGLLSPIVAYYNGQGEQIGTMLNDPLYAKYFVPGAAESSDGIVSGGDLIVRLVAQNAEDYTKLLLNIGTSPAILDHWRAEGRLYSGLLVPFFLIGFALTVRRLRRSEDLVLLTLFLGFGLPLLLTSKVHIGRLIFELPLLLLIVACGFSTPAQLLAARLVNWRFGASDSDLRDTMARAGTLALAALLLCTVALATLHDYSINPAPTPDANIAMMLANGYAELDRPGVAGVLVLGGNQDLEVEQIHSAAVRLQLDSVYRFVDLGRPGAAENNGDSHPIIYYGGLLDLLDKPGAIPGVCNNTYYVDINQGEKFAAIARKLEPTCGRHLRYEWLPNQAATERAK